MSDIIAPSDMMDGRVQQFEQNWINMALKYANYVLQQNTLHVSMDHLEMPLILKP